MLKVMDYMLMEKPIIQYESTEDRMAEDGASLYISNNAEILFAEAIVSFPQDTRIEKTGSETLGKTEFINPFIEMYKSLTSRAHTRLYKIHPTNSLPIHCL